MPKRSEEFELLRWIIGIAAVVYIIGIVPSFTQQIQELFHHPVIKLVFLAIVILVATMDHTLGILLAIAFLLSLWHKPKTGGILGRDLRMLQRQTQKLIGTAPEMKKKPSAVNLNINVRPSVQENMKAGQKAGGAQGAFEEQMKAGVKYYGQGADCTVIPPPSTGCDPIVGYNAPYDCVCEKDCQGDCEKGKRGCLCTGVATWKDELNAQGMNYPMGNAGPQVGATF